MDFTYLETMLDSIELVPQKIRSLVEYIILNTSSNESQISTTLQKSFSNTILDKKLAIFFTVSEILLIQAQKRQIGYFKVFGNKIRPMLESLSRQVKDIRVMKDICRTLDKWQNDQMFASSFMQKLKSVVKDFYEKVRAQSHQEQRSMGFKKYKKTFLMEIQDLKTYPMTYEIYQCYYEYAELQQKLTNLNIEFSKIDFDKSGQGSEINRRRCDELLKLYNDVREKMENVLEKIPVVYSQIRNKAIEEYESVKKESIEYSAKFSN